MNLLISGISGFIGKSLYNSLSQNKDFKIIIISRKSSDLRFIKNSEIIFWDDPLIEEKIISLKVDVIINLITNYGINNDTEEIIHTNLLLPLKLLKYAIKAKISYFLNIGTPLHQFVSEYALSKNQFADWLKYYSNHIKVVNVLPEYIYGPGDKNGKLFSSLLKSFSENVESFSLSQGDQKRDFIFVEDLISALNVILLSLSQFKTNYIEIPVGTGITVSIREFAEKLRSISCAKTILKFGDVVKRINEMSEQKADISIISTLGWKPKFDLENGLIETWKLKKQEEHE